MNGYNMINRIHSILYKLNSNFKEIFKVTLIHFLLEVFL